MRIFKLKNVKSLILTFINVLKIFIISFYRYNQSSSSKFIFFYFPLKAYQENLIELVKLLNIKNNVYVYIIYNSLASDELKLKKNSLFIDFGYLRFIPFSNFFLSKINFLISSYVLYVFLPNTKNIYISHDIYDAPMVNEKIEKKLFKQLSKLDHIFVSSLIVKKYFQQKLKKYVKYKKYLKTKITNTGYLKLDHVSRVLKNKKNKEFHILIAPTSSYNYEVLNLSSNLIDIIYFLLKNKYKIIYRPHPMDLTKKGNNQLVKNVIEKFKDDSNFKTDLSPSYLTSYLKSKVLITDFSGTAYTYSFSTNKPVIFFWKKNYGKLFSNLKKLNYFKDGNEIGYIVNSLKNLNNKLNKIRKNKTLFKDKIKKLRNKRIQYFGNSLRVTKKEIEKLL